MLEMWMLFLFIDFMIRVKRVYEIKMSFSKLTNDLTSVEKKRKALKNIQFISLRENAYYISIYRGDKNDIEEDFSWRRGP